MNNYTEYNVGDAVRVLAPKPYSHFYLYGRIIYIDSSDMTITGYGILYYSENQLAVMEGLDPKLIAPSPVNNPPSCPSHSITMDYVDAEAEKEKELYA